LYYDALGRCVKRTLNGATTYYIYGEERKKGQRKGSELTIDTLASLG